MNITKEEAVKILTTAVFDGYLGLVPLSIAVRMFETWPDLRVSFGYLYKGA